MVNWNKYAEEGKAKKEALENEDLDKAYEGLSVVLDEIFDNPELSNPDRTRMANDLRLALEDYMTRGTRLGLGSSTPAPMEETTEQPEQQPQPSTPATNPAEAARVRELENGISAYVSNAGGTVVQSTDGKIDLAASFATVDRATEKKVNDAKVPTGGLVKKADVRAAVQDIGTAIGDEKTGFHRSRLGTETMVISTDNYNKLVAGIRKIEELASES